MKRFIKFFGITVGAIALICISGLLFLFIYASKNIDLDMDIKLFEKVGGSSVIEYYSISENGTPELIYEASLGQRKIWTDNKDISEYVRLGFISVEDRDFYSHCGFNLKRTLGAMLNYIFHFKSSFGGSTITQQVIKNISGDNDYSIRRKVNEIIRAYNLERYYTKSEILEAYMNIVPMTGNVYGVGAAARMYFEKDADELTLSEAATIIGITNSPVRYNPYDNKEACIKRRNTVLFAMLDNGAITDEEYKEAISEPLITSEKQSDYSPSSWFIETAREDITDDLVKNYGITKSAAELMLGGAKVYLTVDMTVQGILENYFENTDNLPSEVLGGLEISMTVVDNESGNLVGIIGGAGKKKADKILNNATSYIVPASAIKPLSVYAPLLDAGRINWATVIDDTPITFIGEALRPYPKNSPDVYDGLTTVKDAVRLSKNTVSARLYSMMSSSKIIEQLLKSYSFDLSKTDASVSALALGQIDSGITLRGLTDAYTVFPMDGEATHSRSYYAVIFADGNRMVKEKSCTRSVIKKETARIMCKMLEEVVNSGTARRITLNSLLDVGGKTGTSSGAYDRIFVGFTPYYTAGIWVGRPDRTSAVESINPMHTQMWDEVMTEIHRIKAFKQDTLKSFSTDGLVYLPYCKDSGRNLSEVCDLDPRGSRLEYGFFTSDNKPDGICNTHVLVRYDTSTMSIAHAGCPEEDVVDIALLDIKRRFKAQVFITDSEFVYRDISGFEIGDSYDIPYFYYAMEDGEYVGIGKNKKQFNSGCYIHK